MRAPHAVLAATAAALLAAAPAPAAMTASVNSANVVVVTGDAGNDKVVIADGRFGGGDDYGIAMYDDGGGTIQAVDGSCLVVPGPVDTTYCGDHTVARADFNLGGGTDEVNGAGADPWVQLKQIGGDLGAGTDSTSGNLTGLQVLVGGGDGNDHLAGSNLADTIDGGGGDDYIIASSGSDTLRGGAGNDEILALAGDDKVFGDDGNDTLTGGDGSDEITGGAGSDSVSGDGSSSFGQGNDTLNIADGEVDSATCDLGADTVNADAGDTVDTASCENVVRPGGGTSGPGGDPKPTQPTPTDPGPTAPAVTLTAPSALKLAALLTRGVKLSLRASEPASIRVRLVLRRADARKLKLGTRDIALATGSVAVSSTARTLTLRVPARYRSKLKRARVLVLSLRLTAETADGRTSTTTRSVRVRR